MKRMFFLLILGIYVTNLHAQFIEQFSDGDFISNPTWLGNIENFSVNPQGELQLNHAAPAANNTSYLVTNAPVSLNDSTTWEYYIRLQFAASTTNFARVYLLANQANLSASLNGYFLRIGGVAGNNDALELYRQDGTSTTLLLAGTAGAVGGDSVAVRVRVTRSKTGEWTLWADYQGGTDLRKEANAIDVTYAAGDFFGFFCRYTATRNQAFFFDDIRIDPLFSDRTPPKLLTVSALTANQIEVIFDEALDINTAQDPANYDINNNIGKPANAVLIEPNKVLLVLNNPLQNTVNYTLTINNIADINNNRSALQEKTFTFYNIQPAAPGDIIITEIFADPTPRQGLPEAEFVELYNRSNKVIQLQNFGFSAGGTPQRLPAHLLLPGDYIIICDDGVLTDFQLFGKAIPVGSFPAMTNSGDDLTLTDADGQVIFSITYTDDWYQNVEKAQGGWTLELIEVSKNPICEGNWRASIHPDGGTPGTPNSLPGAALDNIPPQLINALIQNDTTILLTFNESLEPNTAENSRNYLVENIIIKEAFLITPTQIILYLATPLQKNQLYAVTFNNQITDCLGNSTAIPATLEIGIAEPWQSGDVIINEVLFNPQSGGSDFIELYNISGKILNLNDLQIINTQKTGSTASISIQKDYLFLPGNYIAITENPQDLRDRYNPPLNAPLLQSDLPTLDDKQGNVTLRYNGVTIDSFDYTDELHFALLTDKEGVSLERIRFTTPTQRADNWHSAAASVRFATPGYRNSQLFAEAPNSEGIITRANTTFSPDNDGFEDYLLLEYNNESPGTTANI
ncbi:MAG: lamin tail domain-containing protein, partial [Saprospiraceae bacterium]